MDDHPIFTWKQFEDLECRWKVICVFGCCLSFLLGYLFKGTFG